MPPEDNQSDSSFDDAPRDRLAALKEKVTRSRSWLRLSAVEHILPTMSPGERAVLYILSILLAASAFTLLVKVNNTVSTTIPAEGGSLIEGVVGTPRFINPLLAISQTDRDLTALIYSGLVRAQPDGSLISDLAQDFNVSDDGTTYTFHIRKNATFHDGKPITADDVLFTVKLAQNPEVKSPRRADWEGVEASAPDSHTVVFKLPHPYAPFLNDTTLGILPKHLWKDVSAQELPFNSLNTEPVGSGPFSMGGTVADSAGTPTSYTLYRFQHFTLGAPYLDSITFKFYPNQDTEVRAISAGVVQSFAGLTPVSVPQGSQGSVLLRAPLMRVFAVFFNQNHNATLADISVRKALDKAVDKQSLVQKVLAGYGEPLNGPIPQDAVAATSSADGLSPEARIAAARTILQNGGWKWDTKRGAWTKGKLSLSLTLATADTKELAATANEVATAWKNIGVPTTVQVYSLSELNTNVLRPRAYDAVLFGEVVGPSLDLFAFWHSSQRNDPGLNLSLYANAKADKLLATARGTIDVAARDKLYGQFASILTSDMPAVFLYAPEFVYVVPANVHGVSFGAITTPDDRFLSAYSWYTDTERVWDLFAK